VNQIAKIDKGIPLPSRGESNRRGAGSKYPWRSMEVGDSFLIPSDDPKKLQRRMYQNYRRYKPMKFETRMVEGGVRIWRTA
jgi:hypothetical protein